MWSYTKISQGTSCALNLSYTSVQISSPHCTPLTKYCSVSSTRNANVPCNYPPTNPLSLSGTTSLLRHLTMTIKFVTFYREWVDGEFFLPLHYLNFKGKNADIPSLVFHSFFRSIHDLLRIGTWKKNREINWGITSMEQFYKLGRHFLSFFPRKKGYQNKYAIVQ